MSTIAPELSAKAAGLHYVHDQSPGFRRIGTGKTFRYIGPSGRVIHDPKVLGRMKRLAIPPAWTHVWITTDPQGHLQAVGRDARGRKQYRYHPHWREIRDSTKYHRMLAFGLVLPKIRTQVEKDLRHVGLQKEKVLATIVRLLELTSIRVGNEEYTRENRSYGLTTLRDRHVAISGEKVSFYFRGKRGIRHKIGIHDRHLARIVRKLRDLPGYELFQYVDDDGQRHPIGSTDVNAYLHQICGEEFTAKDFRTWNGTVLAAFALAELKPFTTQSQAKKNITKAIEAVAERLGNTIAVCRNCYIHPALFDAYMAQTLVNDLKSVRRTRGLNFQESAVLHFLRKASKMKSQPSLEEVLKKSIRKMS